MSKRFQPPSVEELAARGLDAEGNPIKAEEPKKKPGRPKKDASQEDN